MKIIKMNFPEASVLYSGHEKYDYIDSFGGLFDDKNNDIGIDEVTAAFLKPLPRWADSLMALRNRIVGLVGLKRSKKSYGEIAREHFAKDDKIGFFKVYERRNNEIILGEDDKHLNFRISIFLDRNESSPIKKIVVVTTVVTFNNWMGPAYFFFVKPFHKRIVPAMLKKDFSQFSNSVSQ